MMTEVELQALAADIKANGLQQPIAVYFVKDAEGHDRELVLDGRNRELACELAGVDPDYVEIKTDPIAYVLSQNLHRRHLSPSQVAMVVAAAKKLSAEIPNSENLTELAKAAGVAPAQAYLAQQVLDEGAPDLVAAVKDGSVKVSTAAAICDKPEEEQEALVKAGPKAIQSAAKVKRQSRPSVSKQVGLGAREPEVDAQVETTVVAATESGAVLRFSEPRATAAQTSAEPSAQERLDLLHRRLALDCHLRARCTRPGLALECADATGSRRLELEARWVKKYGKSSTTAETIPADWRGVGTVQP